MKNKLHSKIKFIPSRKVDGQENIDEKTFEKQLLSIIEKWKNKEISDDEFIEQSQKLIALIPGNLETFKDEELGWAKYWIEEIDYYGLETVQKNHFNFFKFLDNRS